MMVVTVAYECAEKIPNQKH